MGSLARQARMLAAVRALPLVENRADRITDRRTSGEIVAEMDRIANDPVTIAERDAFYADLRARTAAEHAARFERLENEK